MFSKIVGIEPLSLISSAELKLHDYAKEVTLYQDKPKTQDDIAKRIGEADAVLLSHTTYLGEEALARCPNIRYIGMCCSLYSPESANVDIHYAQSRGITVVGVRDYGDEGVVEYVVSELVRCLHGFGRTQKGALLKPWTGTPREITGLNVGIVGLGTLGGMIADALKFFGANIAYYSRSEKLKARKKGYMFLPLKELLVSSEVVICCLNKNVILLRDEEFRYLGNRKMLFNVGLSPAWDEAPFAKWLENENLFFCDSLGALGNEKYLSHRNVQCVEASAGRTRQAFVRLSDKVIENISNYFRPNP
ncbi:NAD(P)-dependent oxidoreductase [Marinimicrobium sp. ARAG 43.8]|uniref:NAD(P)-dependent oxidoreductase n=1 Tax=Marinimicrobium sp. ARAG 43.8 TaxID=3418719 RepID=UPI003CEBF306